MDAALAQSTREALHTQWILDCDSTIKLLYGHQDGAEVSYNPVKLTHPQLGRCGPQLAREAYLECFRAQSEWIPQWAERVRRANVMFEDGSFNGVPVTLYTRRDNVLLWWLPWLS